MNIFKSFTLLWWQAAFWKISLVSFGIIIGSQWPMLKKYRALWWILFLVPGLYLAWLWFQQ